MNNNLLTSGFYFSGSTDEILEYYIYPISDNRTWESYVEDIDGGDNFADFCEEFFELLDEEDYWESY